MASVSSFEKALGVVIYVVIAEQWGRKVAVMGSIITSFV